MPRTPSTARKATAAAAKKTAAPKPSPAKTAGAAAVADAVTTIASARARRADHPSSAPAAPAGAFIEVALDAVDDSPDNPRDSLPDLPSLAISIREHGVIEPVIVVQDGDRFRIVAGHRRVAAARLAGLRSVPAILRTDDAVAEHIHRMIENLQRVDLNPIEEARGYARLKDLGVKQKAIAEAVGRNQGHVSKRLALLSLPPELAARVGRPEEAGGVTLEQAVDVARLPGRTQIAIAEASHAGDDAKWKGGWDFEQLVRRESRVAEHAAELVDVVKALRTAHVSVLNLDGDAISDPPSTSMTDGPAPLAWLHLDDAAAHAKEPCHAVIVRRSPVGGESLLERWTQEVCTDPGSHAAAASSGAARRVTQPGAPAGAAIADRTEMDAKRAVLDDAAARRTAFADDLVHGKVVRDMTAYVLRGQIRDALLGRDYFLDTAQAAELLGRSEAGSLFELLRFGVVTGTGDKLVRAALAGRLDADLDAVAQFVRNHAYGYASDVRVAVDALAFYGFATAAGYEPADIESDALGGIGGIGGIDDVVLEALQEADLIDGDGSIAGPVDPDVGIELSLSERQLARGVTADCLARATVDGVPLTVALEPGRAIPTGRCTTCGGAAKALTMGAAGRHAPGGGSVRKGHEACEGTELLTLDAVDAAATAAELTVACPDCAAVGSDEFGTRCTRCNGSGLVPAVVMANGKRTPAPIEVPAG